MVLEEVTRLLNLEKQIPSYKYSITVSCLKVIRKLQKCGHLPPSSKIYRSYAAYGQYIDVRIAALECLVDFVKVDGRWEDLQHLLDLLETDPDLTIRHELARLLTNNPPFERGLRHKLDREELVERIWNNMKYFFGPTLQIEIKIIIFIAACCRMILSFDVTWLICTMHFMVQNVHCVCHNRKSYQCLNHKKLHHPLAR